MSKRSVLHNQHQAFNSKIIHSDNIEIIEARRTAFVARFIVLRENRRCKGHREIEKITWEDNTTAEELAAKFRDVLKRNNENMASVDRDIRRALEHSCRAISHFVEQYADRANNSFREALRDYQESNELLFDKKEERPKLVGWKLG